MNEREFVAGAQQLLRSDVWVEIERTMRERAIARFESSSAADDEARREAYHAITAIKAIRRELENRIAKLEHDDKAPKT